MWYNLGSIMIISNSSKGTVGSRDMVVEGSMIRDLTRDIVRDMGTKDGSILIIIIASIIIVRDGIGIGRRVRIVIDLFVIMILCGWDTGSGFMYRLNAESERTNEHFANPSRVLLLCLKGVQWFP